jgi:putative oxidoreductase
MGAPATGVQDFGKLLLRLAVGGLLILHGIFKLRTGISPIVESVVGKGLTEMLSYGVYVGELVGPALILLGLFARAGALFVAVNMGFAVFLVRWQHAGELTSTGGWAIELEAFFLLGALAILCLGSGRFALTRGRGPLD